MGHWGNWFVPLFCFARTVFFSEEAFFLHSPFLYRQVVNMLLKTFPTKLIKKEYRNRIMY